MAHATNLQKAFVIEKILLNRMEPQNLAKRLVRAVYRCCRPCGALGKL